MAWRYDPDDPARLDDAFWAECNRAAASGAAVTVSLNGPFWQMREWVGMEPLCVMMVEQPEFVAQMADHWQRFSMAVLEHILRRVRVDALMLSEDMAYKAHSMISPVMARRFLQPTYYAWRELLRAYEVPLYDMDSDGYIEELIPIWIEAGMNCCNPIEVAAGNDIIHFRERFGGAMAYHGGIDKRALAAGGEAMRAEVARVAPLIRAGGYLPGCDHGVPPDISWPNFVAYTGLLAQLSGWR
jgi:uroporphyrinogen decarboxylase